MKKIKSVCTYCGTGCEIVANVKDNDIQKIEGNKDGVVSEGKLCIKGKYGFEFLYSLNRITKPLISKKFLTTNKDKFPKSIQDRLFLLKTYNKEFFELPYDLACDITAFKLKDIQKKNPKSFAAIGGARTNCESGFLFQKFTREVIGSPNVDNCARICHAPSLAGMKKSLGEGAATNPFEDIYDAQFLIIIGSNTTEAHPIVANKIIKQVNHKKQNIAVFDIRKTKIFKLAKYKAVLPYEANLLFLNMMSYVILKEKLYNKEFIKKRTKNFEAFKESILNDEFANPLFFKKLKGYEYLSELIPKVAREYVSKKSMILWGLGVTEHLDGSYAVSAICNLALLSGNIGKKGAGLMPLRGQNNVQGVCDIGMLPYYNPGYQKPKEKGLMSPEVFDEIEKGSIRAIWNMGEDLAHVYPNLNKVHKLLNSLEFLVVNELFLCESAKYADIVFGVRSAYEKTGVYINAERRLKLSSKLIDSALPDDWEVVRDVAKRLGVDFDINSAQDVWDMTRGDASHLFSGATYERLKKSENGLQWPINENETKILHKETFRTTDGLGHFIYNKYQLRGQVEEILHNKKPYFYLSTGRVIEHYNNSRQTIECKNLEKRHDEDILLVCNEDDFDENKRYTLISKYGKSKALKIKKTNSLKKGTLFCSFHHPASKINFLFGDESDYEVKTPRFKSLKVMVEIEK